MTESSPLHYSTYDLSGLVLTLRDDIRIALHATEPTKTEASPDDAFVCQIEDPVSGSYYRLGISEYTFLSFLDGQTTVAGALAVTAAQRRGHALSTEHAAALCRWLIENQLATTTESRSAGRLLEARKQREQQKLFQSINPITLRITLFNPDRFFTGLTRIFGWLFSTPALVLWCFVVAAGFLSVAANGRRFQFGIVDVVSPHNLLWLFSTWLLLKLIHEIAHGIACCRYGGTVNGAGILLVLFVPLPWVDVTSAWRFPNRRPRMITSAAGMQAELFVAALAAIVWSQTAIGVINSQARNVMLTGSVFSLLFNANPLMRFDGYYLLSDWLRIPNLALHGQRFVGWLGQRCLLGVKIPRPALPGQNETQRRVLREGLVAVYGLAAFAWRLLICGSLLIAAAFLFHGAGIVLATMAIVVWLAMPVVKLFRQFQQTGPKPRLAWITFVSCICAGTIWMLWSVVPWYGHISAPAIVDYSVLQTVRAPVSGFVKDVLVEGGESVTADQIMLRLENHALELEAEELAIAIQQSEQRSRMFRQKEKIAAVQVEQENRAALETRRAQILENLAQLVVRAPVDGTILSSETDALIGKHISAGQDLLQIGAAPAVRALVSQTDHAFFKTQEQQSVDVQVCGKSTRRFAATLQSVQPRATDTLPHPAFAAVAGGSLTVRRETTSNVSHPFPNDDEWVADREPLPGWKLLEPRFTAEIALPSDMADKFLAGQRAIVRVRNSTETVGRHFYKKARAVVRKVVEREQNRD